MVPVPPAPRPGSGSRSMLPDLDAAYHRQLEALARVRRAVAVVATSRKKLELRLSQVRREASEGSVGSELAEVLRLLEVARAEERRMAEAGQRLQVKVNELHDAKAAVEAACVAADETARATLSDVTGN
jgi:phage shock protein A